MKAWVKRGILFELVVVIASLLAVWYAVFWGSNPEILNATEPSLKYYVAIITKQISGISIPFLIMALGFIMSRYKGIRLRIAWMGTVIAGASCYIILMLIFKIFSISLVYDIIFPLTRNTYAPLTGVIIGALVITPVKNIFVRIGHKNIVLTVVAILLIPLVFNKDVFMFNGGNSVWFGLFAFLIGVALSTYRHESNPIRDTIVLLGLFLLGVMATVAMTQISDITYASLTAATRFVDYSSFLSVVTAAIAIRLTAAGMDDFSDNHTGLLAGWFGVMAGTGSWVSTSLLQSANDIGINTTKQKLVVTALISIGCVLVGLLVFKIVVTILDKEMDVSETRFDSVQSISRFIQGTGDLIKNFFRRFGKPLLACAWIMGLSLLSIVLSNFSWGVSYSSRHESVIGSVILTRFPVIVLTSMALLSLFILLIAITSRFWVSMNLLSVTVVGFVVVNRLKVQARQEPLLPSDLSMLKALPDLIGMVSYKLVVIVVLTILVVAIFTIWLELKHPVAVGSWRTRLALLAVPFAFTAMVLRMNHTDSMAYSISSGMGNSPRFYKQLEGSEANGSILQFINNFDMTAMNKPRSYSKKAMMQIKRKYIRVAEIVNKSRENDFYKQTIIFNLSESFADPLRVPELTLNRDPIPYIRAFKKQTTSGVMMSSGYGGGTADMEYASLTSLDLAAFAPSLSTPFTQLPFSNSYGPSVAKLFKNTSGIHPNTALYYNRVQDYPKLGIKKFYYLGSKYKIRYQKKIQNSPYLSDETAYDNARSVIAGTKKGQFINLVTMQNHFPYTDHYYSGTKFKGSGPALSDESDVDQINQYSIGLSYTDTAVKKFIKEIDNINKPITFIWYGDHLPGGIYNGLDVTKNNVALHETDYFIYSNKYAREHEGATKKLNYSVTDPSQFTSLAMTQTNSKVSAYYAMMNDVTKKLPAMSVNLNASDTDTNRALMVNEQGKQVSASSLSAKQKKLLRDYQLIQYDTVSGKHYLGDDFFTKIIK